MFIPLTVLLLDIPDCPYASADVRQNINFLSSTPYFTCYPICPAVFSFCSAERKGSPNRYEHSDRRSRNLHKNAVEATASEIIRCAARCFPCLRGSLPHERSRQFSIQIRNYSKKIHKISPSLQRFRLFTGPKKK